MTKTYFVYILTNNGGTVLYGGVTNDLRRRVAEHASARGCEFTAKYQVHRLLYFEAFDDVRFAIAREKQIKSWSRKKKEALIRAANPRLENVARQL